MLTAIFFLIAVGVSYIFGSFCSAVIVCRLFSLPDPRLEGSKNPGATNVLRLAGKKYAAIVLLADMLKGVIPLLLGHMFGAGSGILGFMCLAAVLGHMYPVFFEFKGGKGVATALGALLGFSFSLGLLTIVTWFIVAKLSRYSSLSSMISIGLAPFYLLFIIGNMNAFLPVLFMACFIFYKHYDNIERLIDGTESKIEI